MYMFLAFVATTIAIAMAMIRPFTYQAIARLAIANFMYTAHYTATFCQL